MDNTPSPIFSSATERDLAAVTDPKYVYLPAPHHGTVHWVMASERQPVVRERRPDLVQRVPLHPLDPEEGLRKLLRQPPLDQPKTPEMPPEGPGGVDPTGGP
jgi:hypothetical protein